MTWCYLDHAATTPMRTEAVEAMLPYLTERYANPSGSHRFARAVRGEVDDAREVVAGVIGCRPGEVVFTGCGTESDNTAIAGALARRPGRAVCPAVEHHAVLASVEAAHGALVGVDSAGHVDLDALSDALAAEPAAVVSVMAVNNEVGTITDLAAVATIVRRLAPGAVLHTDAVQAASWLDLAALWPHVDALSLSAHKFGGPKGVGVLVVREGTSLAPLLIGGGQERERRSGTHDVAGIAALSAALRLTAAERVAEGGRIGALARPARRRPARRARRRRRDGAARSQGRRLRARVHRRRRERGAAVPARRGRGVRHRGVVVRQRGDGAVARAGRDGGAAVAGDGRAAPDARTHHDGCRRRPRRGGGDRRRHPAASGGRPASSVRA
ncbi:MAG: aminotransferase class V-fold PLP-dependent enzyme [Ilumatobacteraceae bacterium]